MKLNNRGTLQIAGKQKEQDDVDKGEGRRTKEEVYMFHVSWQHQDQVSVINALKFIKLH